MKKMKIFLSIVIALFGVLFFSQCKKTPSECTLRLKCVYPTNNNKDSVANNVMITFDTTHYDYTNHTIDTFITRVNADTNLADLSDAELLELQESGKYGYKTEKDGVFTYHLPYPVFLIVHATKVDSVKNEESGIFELVRYTATTNVKLERDETSDVKLIIRPN